MARPPMRSSSTLSSSLGGLLGGGGRVPPIIGILIAATLVCSLVGAVGAQLGLRIMAACALVPGQLLVGEVWRLFTWVFFEESAWGLVFACLSLYWFGRDLALRWGPARFVLAYFGFSAAAGIVTLLVGLAYRPLLAFPYVGSWPAQEALIILWAAFYPSRQILMFFALPMSGRRIIWVTIAITALMAAFQGFFLFIPHFAAEGLALAYVSLPSPRAWWLEVKLRGMEKKRRATHLKAVPREPGPRDARDGDDDSPPGGRWLN